MLWIQANNRVIKPVYIVPQVLRDHKGDPITNNGQKIYVNGRSEVRPIRIEAERLLFPKDAASVDILLQAKKWKVTE